ncbi:MAG: acylphosphatase [Bacteroidetes bacterium]|jgi:acylphosphatase|nr:acylphosphatase [Bacteroidota bacterium]
MNDSTPNRTRQAARVTGRVQGVGFRHFTRQTARRLDLSGWVRNEPDGSVRLEAEGPPDAVEQLMKAVHAGPPAARVDEVDTDARTPTGSTEAFRVRYHS